MMVSSKSPQAAALMPILVAIAEPQLPEPMSATFSPPMAMCGGLVVEGVCVEGVWACGRRQ